jgi:hypothetical protein
MVVRAMLACMLVVMRFVHSMQSVVDVVAAMLVLV